LQIRIFLRHKRAPAGALFNFENNEDRLKPVLLIFKTEGEVSMNENIATKGFIGAIVGVGAYLANRIDAVLVVLAIFLILDYIAGVTLALLLGQFDKKKGVQGAIKKLFYIVLVLIGFLLDFVISTVAQDAGLAFTTGGVLGLAVTLYLIGNEGLSIMESLVGIGLPVPPFLQKAFGYVKDSSGKLVKVPEKSKGSDAK